MSLSLLALNATLKRGEVVSSTDKMLAETLALFEKEGVQTETLRVTDFDIKPGVRKDEGAGDQWPELRDKILRADILVLGSPIWMGQVSSVCKRVLERLDAELSETDDKSRNTMFGKVAAVAVVGNEDGAHHVSAMLYQALNDVGFTVPAQAVTYWVGEAMDSKDYKDLDEIPKKVRATQQMLAANCIHLARLLKQSPYPGVEKD